MAFANVQSILNEPANLIRRASAKEIMDSRTSRFADRVAALFERDGLPPIAGRIFALLLVSEDARSLDQLSEDLGISKASASTNARLLAQFGLVEPVRRPGSRRDYYRTADDLFERSMARRLDQWREFTEVIGEGRRLLSHGRAEVRDRLTRYEDALSFMTDAIGRAMVQWRRHPAQALARAGSGR